MKIQITIEKLDADNGKHAFKNSIDIESVPSDFNDYDKWKESLEYQCFKAFLSVKDNVTLLHQKNGV